MALVAALADGLIDVVMSDHNPQDVETKRLPFAEAAAGAIGLETMLTAGLRLVHAGEIDLIAAAARDVDAAGGDCSACPAARCGPARRPISIVHRSRRALGARPGRAEVEVQEHAVRRGAHAGPRRAHHRCRPHRLRIRLMPSRRAAIACLSAHAECLHHSLGLVLRLSARLDPVRPDADAGSPARRHPHHRLRQYRRDQRAAHRPQGARRRDAARATC